MARALIVGCGCRGRELGALLAAEGWQVRGTTRTDEGEAAIAAAGLEPARADPDRVGSVLELVGDVTAVVWALGSAGGPPETVEAVNGPRLESFMEHLVDTPVRAFVYDGAGPAPADALARGERATRDAGRRWHLPVAVVAEPDSRSWAPVAAATLNGLLGIE